MFLGFPIGAVAGGAITASVMSQVGWRGVFVGGGALSLLLLPIAFIMVTELRGGGSGKVIPCGATVLGAHCRRPAVRHRPDLPVCILDPARQLLSDQLDTDRADLARMSPERAAVAGVVLNLGGVLSALAMSILLTGRSPFGPVALCLGIGGVLTMVLGQSVLGEATLILVLIFAVGAFVIGGQMNFPALGVYFYPEEVRATGVGLAMGVGRFGSIVGPLLGAISCPQGWVGTSSSCSPVCRPFSLRLRWPRSCCASDAGPPDISFQ